jgi:hypothetical protein
VQIPWLIEFGGLMKSKGVLSYVPRKCDTPMRTDSLKKSRSSRNHRHKILSRFRVLTLLSFLWVCHTSAFSQMGSSSTYSDSWVDDSNPDAGAIVSIGVTQDSSNGYGHTYWVVTTLTSPNSRTARATSYQTNGYNAYTRAETTLPWDSNDLGDYSIGSQHWMCCPYMGGNPYTGAGCFPSTTSVGAKAGSSRATYSFTSQNFCCCTYHIIPNCYVRCGPPEVSRVQVSACAAYIQRIQTWYEVSGYTFCVASPVFFVDFANWVPCSEE